VVVIALALVALLAPLIAPQNPYDLARLVADGCPPPAGIRRIRRLPAHPRDRRAGAIFSPRSCTRLRISIQIGVLLAWRRRSSAPRWGRVRPISAADRSLHHGIVDLQLSFPAILLALMLRRCSARA